MTRDDRPRSRELNPVRPTKSQQRQNRSRVLAWDMENALWALKHYVQLLLNDGGVEQDSAHRYLLSLRALVPPQRHEEFGIVHLARQYEQTYGEEHEPGDVPDDPAEIAQWIVTMRSGRA